MGLALVHNIASAQTATPPGKAPENLPPHVTLNTGKRNFDALTGLRFFAAIGVVLYHFGSILDRSWPRPLANIIDASFVAVSFFYVLSGFVLAYSFVNASGELQGNRRSFWVARLARIYPAYLLAFLLAAPTNVAWTMRVNTLPHAVVKLLSGGISVLTLQQAWTPWSAWYWNYPGWSVSVETFFYLVFPFFALLLRRFGRRGCVWGMSLLWVVSLLPPLALWLLHGPATGTADKWCMAVEFTPLLRLPEFLIGMLLGRAYLIGFRFSPRAAIAASYIGLTSLLAALAFSPAVPRPFLSNGLLVPIFAILILALAEGRGLAARFLSWAPLILLGEASYGIYILQVPVSYLLRMPPPLTTVSSLLIFLPVLLVVALLSWRFVECPLRLQIRRRLLQRDRSSEPVSNSSSKPPTPPRPTLVHSQRRPSLSVSAEGTSSI